MRSLLNALLILDLVLSLLARCPGGTVEDLRAE